VAVQDGKHDPLDFVLWKSAKPRAGRGEMAQPFGEGRPGWHIECSAMAARCWARALTSTAAVPTCSSRTTRTRSPRAKAPPASRWPTWMHNGFINVDNEKMSKSLGNFFTIRDVLKEYDAETVRFFIVRTTTAAR
jgi:cysteinyl-tRNA synthetase